MVIIFFNHVSENFHEQSAKLEQKKTNFLQEFFDILEIVRSPFFLEINITPITF